MICTRHDPGQNIDAEAFVLHAGDIDFHFFIKYEWPNGVNDAENSAFAEDQLNLMAPYVASTQVGACALCRLQLYPHGVSLTTYFVWKIWMHACYCTDCILAAEVMICGLQSCCVYVRLACVVWLLSRGQDHPFELC